MKKPPSTKRQAVKQLKFFIRQTRKLARQINRKLESLKQMNQAVAACKQELVRICGLK